MTEFANGIVLLQSHKVSLEHGANTGTGRGTFLQRFLFPNDDPDQAAPGYKQILLEQICIYSKTGKGMAQAINTHTIRIQRGLFVWDVLAFRVQINNVWGLVWIFTRKNGNLVLCSPWCSVLTHIAWHILCWRHRARVGVGEELSGRVEGRLGGLNVVYLSAGID